MKENGDTDSGFRKAVSGNVPAWLAFVVFILISVVGAIGTWALSRASSTGDAVIDLRVRVGVVEANRTNDKTESDRRFSELSDEVKQANTKLDRLLSEKGKL